MSYHVDNDFSSSMKIPTSKTHFVRASIHLDKKSPNPFVRTHRLLFFP